MKELKRRLETFSFYDHTGIEKHLEDMAEKGWLLSKTNRFFWVYLAQNITQFFRW